MLMCRCSEVCLGYNPLLNINCARKNMEAERLNAIINALTDLADRAGQLRRYL